MKDYYAILGVPSSATASDIKRAYRKLAVTFHPDKNPDPKAQALFVEINEAYDTLGDLRKRSAYDERLRNPYAQILDTAQPPRHRDPAYRRTARPKPANKESESHLLMKEYLPKIQWISWLGLLLTGLFFLDYAIPYSIKEEAIDHSYPVQGRRGPSAFVYVTATNMKIKLYHESLISVASDTIRYGHTAVYRTVMWVQDSNTLEQKNVAFPNTAVILFPFGLFITSILGIIYAKKIEFCFNVTIVSAVLILIFWYLV